MQKIFNHILVPVRFGRKPGEGLDKAIEFANQLNCHLHLLYTGSFSWWDRVRQYLLPSSGVQRPPAGHQYRLFEIRNRYAPLLRKGLKLFATLQKGNTEQLVTDYAEQHNIDMILVMQEPSGLLEFDVYINPGRLAAQAHCPVLTTRNNTGWQSFKSIVLPIGTILPVNKIKVAIYLAHQFGATIHLLAMEKNGLMDDDLANMKKAFQVLKDNTELPVVCATRSGSSLAAITLEYAYSVQAGLIVVNTGDESTLPVSVNRPFSRFVVSESKVPVITVA